MHCPRSRLAPFFSLSPSFCLRGWTRLSRSSLTAPVSRNYSLAREVGGVPFIRAPRLTRNAEFPLPSVAASPPSGSRPSRARCCRPSASLAVPPGNVAPWAPWLRGRGCGPLCRLFPLPSVAPPTRPRSRPRARSAIKMSRLRPLRSLSWCCIGVVLVLCWCWFWSVSPALARGRFCLGADFFCAFSCQFKKSSYLCTAIYTFINLNS